MKFRALVFLFLALLIACNRDKPAGKEKPVPSQSASATTPAPAPSSPSPVVPTLSPSKQPQSPPPPPANDAPALQLFGKFSQPIFVSTPPGDPRLFVVEKGGKIKVWSGGNVLPTPFLDITSQVSSDGERGLFAVAFAPDYASSGLVYVSYTDNNGDSRVDEYRVLPGDPNRLDTGTKRQIIFVGQPFPNHNGGLILFDPSGKLIFGLGDGGSGGDPGNRAQDLNNLLGKLLRIDPRNPGGGKAYGIPPDNPYAGGGAKPEIFAYGLRNPWRFSYETSTGDLYLADVGQNAFEEVNRVAPSALPAANFGWRRYEGNSTFNDQKIDESRLVRPVHVYGRSGGCSVTGGYVYRGQVVTLRGAYIYADFCQGKLLSFRMANGAATTHKPLGVPDVPELSSFGEDSAGELYVMSLNGKVFRIVRK